MEFSVSRKLTDLSGTFIRSFNVLGYLSVRQSDYSQTQGLKLYFPGIRAFHSDRHPGHVTGRLGDGPRLHLRHPQAPAHDHLGRWEGLDTGKLLSLSLRRSL